MNPIQNAIQVDEEIAAPLRERPAEKNPVARQILLDRVNQSLVTLAPAADVLDPKQQVMAEQFRLLRTRVKSLSKNFQLRSILVTSALAGEGKTTVAANLAGSLSHIEGLRILLIDFDLRQPSLHTVFGVEADTRSASALAGDTPWRSALYRINRRLDVLFGFHALEEPDQLLQSRRLETLLEDVKSGYDVVILDSAPLLAISDTQSLVPLVDCALFVVNADRTEVGAAREALSMLQGKVAGCVVNRVRHLKSEGYYTKSGYGYGYYGAKRTEKRK